eukprot:TRINITY_DN4236_c0_g1_i2.p1 TRINITY_DN4236_c0_g1~~TRINITY_DN4236_c0_g1_i2.p1  ORF type:complete len:247 (-),score=23.36 TRINITY_DN4236_c0_g1_i2:520-1260(-)
MCIRDRDYDKKRLKKTGLGSSSCVVVVTVSSILALYNVINDHEVSQFVGNIAKRIEDKTSGESTELCDEEYAGQILNLLCQTANALAQNKIGSGFDISTCLYGNQIYTRFPRDSLSSLLTIINQDEGNLEGSISELVKKKYKDFRWITQPVALNKEIQMFMLEFAMSTDTRVSVGNLTKFLDSHPDESTRTFCKTDHQFTHLVVFQRPNLCRARENTCRRFAKRSQRRILIARILDCCARNIGGTC